MNSKIIGRKTIIFITIMTAVITYFAISLNKENWMLILVGALAIYFITGFFFFKVIVLTHNKMIFKSYFNFIKKEESFPLDAINKVHLHCRNFRGSVDTVIIFFKNGNEKKMDLKLTANEFKNLHKDLMKSGVEAKTFYL